MPPGFRQSLDVSRRHQEISMIEALSLSVVVLAGLYFIALAATSLFVPAQADRFLLGFASSPLKHFAELILRFLVGGALVLHAPHMYLSRAFSLFGWILLGTTVCLFLIPWRWHSRFAQHAVPWATRYMALIGLASLALGGLILAAVIRGSAA